MRKHLIPNDFKIAVTQDNWVEILKKRVDFLHVQQYQINRKPLMLREYSFLQILLSEVNKTSDKEILPFLIQLDNLGYPFSSQDLKPCGITTYIVDQRLDKNFLDFYEFMRLKNVDFESVIHLNGYGIYIYVDESSNVNLIKYFEKNFSPIEKAAFNYEMYCFGSSAPAEIIDSIFYYLEEDIIKKIRTKNPEKIKKIIVHKIISHLNDVYQGILNEQPIEYISGHLIPPNPLKDKKHYLTQYMCEIMERMSVEEIKIYQRRIRPCYDNVIRYVHKHGLKITPSSIKEYAINFYETFHFYPKEWFNEHEIALLKMFEKRLNIVYLGEDLSPAISFETLKERTRLDFQKYTTFKTFSEHNIEFQY